MSVYIQIMWSGDVSMKISQRNGRHAVTAKGTVEERLACPVDPRWWKDYLEPSLETLARHSLKEPALRGVVIDTEQYQGKETSGAVGDIYCFCDDCMTGFLEDRKIQQALPVPAKRSERMEKLGLLADYRDHLEKQVQKLASTLATRLAKINPAFEIHFYCVEEGWFYRGFLKGLAANQLPVCVLDSSTYNGYLPKRGEKMRQMLAACNPKAIWMPGYYTDSMTARGIGITIRKMNAEKIPWWLYNQEIPFPEKVLGAVKNPPSRVEAPSARTGTTATQDDLIQKSP
ncbi:MAG: hypothetical protein HY360_04455 [Verrucomicrobia bacterium]|nr:hypothetical protein [Verrucomicrobiota bacterium]